MLLRSGTHCMAVKNGLRGPRWNRTSNEFYNLGLGTPSPSPRHGHGTGTC